MLDLQKLINTYGISGDEGEISDLIASLTKDYATEVYKDILGNLVVHKKGNGKKLMFAAHMDEIGIMVTYIDDNGFIRFGMVGGVDKYNCLYQRVKFKNGTVGVVGYEEKISDIKNIKVSNLYIDIGAKNREEAEKMVSVGDTAVFLGECIVQNNRVISHALDNRIGVYVLIEAIKRIKNNKNDLYFVFTVQEEVGLRGAKTSAFSIEPDYAIAVDVTDTGDTPECNVMAVSLGNGAAIKIKDSSVLCNREVVDALKECANKNKIKYQLEVLEAGGTDAGAIHLTKGGIKTGAVSIPVRYIHTPCETADLCDVENAISLIEKIEF
ncbi:MAG: M42 family metallopeptidase [Ruminococcaceae bacterium]|nr:M42 family metallopeptidase [Oscillospiraceae bacterium]